MKTKKVTCLFISSIVWLALLTIPFQTVSAQEGATGGAVQTNGEIGFFTEGSSTEPSTSDSKPPTTSSTTGTSDVPVKAKPVGRYPSTGELVKKSLSISGAALVLIALLLLLFKRKKKEAGE